jgi:hypothetical protein
MTALKIVLDQINKTFDRLTMENTLILQSVPALDDQEL